MLKINWRRELALNFTSYTASMGERIYVLFQPIARISPSGEWRSPREALQSIKEGPLEKRPATVRAALSNMKNQLVAQLSKICHRKR